MVSVRAASWDAATEDSLATRRRLTGSGSNVDDVSGASGLPGDHLSPDEMLDLWQRRWEPLTAEMQRRFLARPELDELTRLPESAVRLALGACRRLSDVLDRAVVLAGAPVSAPRPAPASKSPSRPAPQPAAGSTPQPKQRTKRGRSSRGHVAPILGGTPSGGTGPWMSRPQSWVEPAIGERCSACGAWVPSGASHDCS